MSSGITVKFKNNKDKREFLSIFDAYKDNEIGNFPIAFIFRDNNGDVVSQLSFKSHYAKTSIDFEYHYNDCDSVFCYYLAYEVSKKYNVKLLWDTNGVLTTPDKFFEEKDTRYHSSFLFFFGLNTQKDFDLYLENKTIGNDCYKRALKVKETEEHLKNVVCPGFFENNKFVQYIWE